MKSESFSFHSCLVCLPAPLMLPLTIRAGEHDLADLGSRNREEGVRHRVALGAQALGIGPPPLVGLAEEVIPDAALSQLVGLRLIQRCGGRGRKSGINVRLGRSLLCVAVV